MKKQVVSPYFCLEDLRHENEVEPFFERIVTGSKAALESEGAQIEKKTFDRNPEPITNPRGMLARIIFDCEVPEEKSEWKLFVSSRVRKEGDKNIIDSEFYFSPEARSVS